MAIWVLIALADEPCHIYGLQGQIFGRSLSYVIPNKETLRSSVAMLLRAGLIETAGTTPGRASHYERKLYKISKKGLIALRSERTSLKLLTQGIDRALASHTNTA
jgi:DNA-binding PadR family transcriptional regulator